MTKKGSQSPGKYFRERDLALIAACWVAAYYLFFGLLRPPSSLPPIPQFSTHLLFLPLILAIWGLTFRTLGLYRRRMGSPVTEWRDVTVASAVGAVVLLVLLRGILPVRYSGGVILLFLALSTVVVALSRGVYLPQLRLAQSSLVALGRRLTSAVPGSGRLPPRVSPRLFGVVDLGLVAASWLAAYYFHFHFVRSPFPPIEIDGLSAYLLVLPLILWFWRLAFRVCGVSKPSRQEPLLAQWKDIVLALTLGGVVLLAILRGVFASLHYSRGVVLYFWLFSVAVLGLSRIAYRRWAPAIDDKTRDIPVGGGGGSIQADLRRFLVATVSYRFDATRRLEVLVASLAVAILVAGHLRVGAQTAFLPCTLDCGETYEGHVGAWNLHRLGITHVGGLQDFAASPELSAHPTVYTHNPNIGMFFMYALFRLGVDDVHSQTVWVALPFGLGLLYLYLFIRAVSRSGILAALCLLNASALYSLVTLWGFNPLRSFSWLLTFGPAYHLYRYSRSPDRPRRHLVLAVAYMALALGIDYTFAAFSAVSLLMLGALKVVRIPLLRFLVIVLAAYGLPFVLRQIQVAAAIGPDVWARDFGYSILRRFAPAGLLVKIPTGTELVSWYWTHNILKWPDPGHFTPSTWAKTVAATYVDVLGLPIVGFGLLWVSALLVLRGRDALAIARRGGGPVVALVRVLVAFVAAQVAAFAMFGGYFAGFYGFAVFPLFVHSIVPLFGLTTYLLLANVRKVAQVGRRAVPVGAILLVLFVAWRVGAEVKNYAELPPHAYPGREALRELQGHSFVTYWISSAVSTYTRQWAARLHATRWRVIEPVDLPFDPVRDYYFFFEADRGDPRYGRPEFLFIPAIQVDWWFDNRTCEPLRGHISTFVDGCNDLDRVVSRFGHLPLYRRGPDYLIYDLRPLYGRIRWDPTPDGWNLARRGIR